MKKILQMLVLGCACGAWAQSVQFVVPNGLADVEGNSLSADLFRTVSTSYQQVYDASAFPQVPMIRIDGMSFRFDGGSGQTFFGFWSGISFILSTTTRSPDSLSPEFGDNAGSDDVIVFGGTLRIFAPTSPGPRPFEEVPIHFQTPFFYEPSRGNLSVFIVSPAGPAALGLDAQMVLGDSVGRVYGDGLSGVVDSGGLVTRFELTLIPEPSTQALVVVGVFTGCLWHFIGARMRKRWFP